MQPRWKISKRVPDNTTLNETQCKPGPGHYEVRGTPGSNYPIKHGTLYDIKRIGERMADQDFQFQKTPGPGHYRQKSIFDQL